MWFRGKNPSFQSCNVRSLCHCTWFQRSVGSKQRRLHQEDLEKKEQEELTAIRQASSTAETLYGLAQEFMYMLRHLKGEGLDNWLNCVRASQIPELQSLVKSIKQDKAAILAGLTLQHNNGVVEGKVNKLKLIKRMMFGRAGFALLRQRVLHVM